MGEISGLEPKRVFEYFEEITAIPRPSKHERRISDYLVRFARERNLFVKQDETLNVIIKKEASKGCENAKPVILQAHMDMVCVAEEDKKIDFTKEGIEAYIDGDFIKAKGTSLGADNGIAIAMILAILDDDSIVHPPIEAVFTADEEEGMGGASSLDTSILSGKSLINIDTEEEDNIIVGCAGGCRTTVFLPVRLYRTKGLIYEIKISGLHGGHSGTDINKNYANANVLVGRVLNELSYVCDYSLASVEGGLKDNAICDYACASIMVLPSQKSILFDRLPQISDEICAEYFASEPDMKFTLTNLGEGVRRVLSKSSLQKYLVLANLIPNGVVSMSQNVPGMVETSLNLGIVGMENREIRLTYAIRSSLISERNNLQNKISLLAKNLGATVMTYGSYPAWKVKKDSVLRDMLTDTYRTQFGKEYNVLTIHAGLECGVLFEKIDGLDAVSIGPDMYDVHSTKEKLSISSVERIWEYLKIVLSKMATCE